MTAHTDIISEMHQLGQQARAAAARLARSSVAERHAALAAAAATLFASRDRILDANAQDIRAAEQKGLTGSMLDRLLLNEARVKAMAEGIRAVADLPDPLGRVLSEWSRPNGLRIQRVSVPLGVIGIIYESRPNVTADAGALCLKSGNAVILRGGSESYHSSTAIHACMAEGLQQAGLPTAAIQMVPTTDRAAVGALLSGLQSTVDVIVPRGGRSLIERVQADARVPVIGHLEGICHVYVHAAADVAKARDVVLNAKMRRTGICGAAETLLIDRACLDTHWTAVADALLAAGCEIRADAELCARDSRLVPASAADWDTEYLDAIISAAVVDGPEQAIAHIAAHGSGHTEAIITEDDTVAGHFFRDIDSAILLQNASTQFADGGEFGMGAEIGIATGKIHARGPVGAEQLTSYKYIVRGNGQTRP